MQLFEINKCLKTYNYYPLKKSVDLYKSNLVLPRDNLFETMNIFLLAVWWQDYTEAKKEIINLKINEYTPHTYFFLIISFMAIGDTQNVFKLKNNPPKNMPLWMSEYIEIEFLGRSAQTKKQLVFIDKLFKKHNKLPDYVLSALLSSSEHKLANKEQLKNWSSTNSYLKKHADNPLISSFYARNNNFKFLNANSENPIEKLFLVFNSIRENNLIDALVRLDKIVSSDNTLISLVLMKIWLTLSLSLPQGRPYLTNRVNAAIELMPQTTKLNAIALTYELINRWMSFDLKGISNIYSYMPSFLTESLKGSSTEEVFFKYIYFLCVRWEENKSIYINSNNDTFSNLIVIGESHSLSPSNVFFKLQKLYKANSSFIFGIKMHHLSVIDSGYQSYIMKEILKNIQPNTDIMFTIGEIDTRPDEGIWQVHLKKEKAVDEIINDTVGGYIEFLYENLKDKNLSSVTIQGIPAPNYALEGDKDPKDKEGFLNMIKQVNEKLQELTLEKGWNFLDVYSATLGEDGKSNKKWHIDGYHLSPVFYPSEADKWLIKPHP